MSKTEKHKTTAKRYALGSLIAACLTVAVVGNAQNAPQPEYLLKAKILVAFGTLYATFEKKPLAANENLVICVVGAYPFRDYFQRPNVRLSSRAILVRRIAPEDPIDDCRVLYVSADEDRLTQPLLKRTSGKPILTVGESPQFVDAGGVMAFESTGNRIEFSVNLDACKIQGIHFPANVLKLAKKVVRSTAASVEAPNG